MLINSQYFNKQKLPVSKTRFDEIFLLCFSGRKTHGLRNANFIFFIVMF